MGMPVVFVIARDWALRANVRAELRERGIEALGMENADAAGVAIAAGQMPAAVVLEATAGIADKASIGSLVERVPTILIASRTETIAVPAVAAVVYRPVRIGEIVEAVMALLGRGHSA